MTGQRRHAPPGLPAGSMPDDGGVDEELAPSASSKFYLNNAPYTARIKRMMQSDEDVGRVAKATPILICECGRRVTLRCSRWGGPAVPALEPGFCTAWQDARAKGSTGATPDAARPTAAGCGRETAVPGQTPQAPTHPTTAAKALDVFLANLVEGAVRLAQERGAKALTAAHMCVARMAVSGDAPWPAPALPGRRGACADAHTAPLLDGRWCRAVPVWPGTREGMPVSEGMREGARPPARPPAAAQSSVPAVGSNVPAPLLPATHPAGRRTSSPIRCWTFAWRPWPAWPTFPPWRSARCRAPKRRASAQSECRRAGCPRARACTCAGLQAPWNEGGAGRAQAQSFHRGHPLCIAGRRTRRPGKAGGRPRRPRSRPSKPNKKLAGRPGEQRPPHLAQTTAMPRAPLPQLRLWNSRPRGQQAPCPGRPNSPATAPEVRPRPRRPRPR